MSEDEIEEDSASETEKSSHTESQGGATGEGESDEPAEAGERSPMAEVVSRHRERVLALSGVVGIAVGLSREKPGQTCVLVYTERGKRPAELEEEIEGYRVEIVDTGGGFRPL